MYDVYVYAQNECENIADFAPCFIPDAHRLLFSCTFVSRYTGGKLSSLSVSIFQSRRVMSASRRQAVVALTEKPCQDTRESIGDENTRDISLSLFIYLYISLYFHFFV